ncbi:MAG: hypothetical protein R2831_04365 [Chitinophagaceae bacterium]
MIIIIYTKLLKKNIFLLHQTMPYKKILLKVIHLLIDEWNKTQLEAFIEHFSDDFILTSPNVKLIFPENENFELRTKSKLRTYLDKLKNRDVDFKVSGSKINLELKTAYFTMDIESASGRSKAFVEIRLNEYGKVFYFKIDYK